MKRIVLLSILFSTQVFARESLYSEKPVEVAPPKTERAVQKPKTKAQVTQAVPSGNLDTEILGKRSGYAADGAHVIVPTGKVSKTYPGLLLGEVFEAVIEESLFAFPDSNAPVRARVLSGKLRGGLFVGTATLEKNSKRILIDFSSFVPRSKKDLYQVSAQGLDARGILGVEGEYKSSEAKFFTAEFLAAAAASYADASIERSQNVLGNYVEAPGVDTMGKKALSGALSKSAERFAEKVRQAPAYSVLQGPVTIRVLVGG